MSIHCVDFHHLVKVLFNFSTVKLLSALAVGGRLNNDPEDVHTIIPEPHMLPYITKGTLRPWIRILNKEDYRGSSR